MYLSKFLKVNKKAFIKINVSTVILLLLLQAAIWYPFLSKAQDELNKQTRLTIRSESDWAKTQQQANQLRDINLPDHSWVQHKVEETKDGVPTQWSVNGSASLMEWQSVLESIETQFSLSLLAASWQKDDNENWRGHLLFAIEPPKVNREYHNWLPTKLHMNLFEPKDWQLLSTMRVGDKTSALVTYKNAQHWVDEGSWLPEAGVTVHGVSFDRVTLIAKDGSENAVIVKSQGEQGGQND